jgi:PDZ domain
MLSEKSPKGRLSSFCKQFVVFTAQLALFQSFSPISFSFPGNIRIDYVVDVRPTSEKVLSVRAQIDGLPKGEITLRFAQEEDPADTPKRISSLSVRTAQGENSGLEIEGCRVTFENHARGAVQVSYQLESESLVKAAETTYLDQDRCLFHTQDALFAVEDKIADSELSFILPAEWKVITPARRVRGAGYRVNSKRNIAFYLGEAREINSRLDNLSTNLVIESAWTAASLDVSQEMKGQMSYLGKWTRASRPQPLMVVFLSPLREDKRDEVLIWGKEGLVIILAPPPLPIPSEMSKTLKYKLAEKLVGCYLPVPRTPNSSEIGKSLVEYLTWKTCLKAGSLSRGEFLEKMAQGFRELPVEVATDPVAFPTQNVWLRSQKVESPSDSLVKVRGTLTFFLIDLALVFYGKEYHSIEEFLQTYFKADQDLTRDEVGLLSELQSEQEASRIAELLLDGTAPLGVAQVLRPFGLILVRTELPSFEFELSESFQIIRLGKGIAAGKTGLRLGDRIVALNGTRLITPSDLFKSRSLLQPGEEVTLTVERNGTTLNLTGVLEPEVYLRLETNKLADSDKQERLARFLAKEIES